MARAHPETPIEIGLAAAVVAVEANAPRILTARMAGDDLAGLPSGSFDPLLHRTLDIGLRDFVTEQTGLSLGYVEQLYTFGDRGRNATPGDEVPHVVSIGYLALTRMGAEQGGKLPAGARFRGWYEFIPWEDWRGGRPAILERTIWPALSAWAGDRDADAAEGARRPLSRAERVRLCFGFSPAQAGTIPATRSGTRRRCWSATSCSTKRACSRKPAATAAPPPWPAPSFPGSASRCASTTAASSPRRWAGFAPS